MSCIQTFMWLRHKLLPAVGRWRINEEICSYRWWQRKPSRKALAETWEAYHVRVWERRQYPLLENERYRSIGVVAAIEELQYRMKDGSPRFYITPAETRKLYRALILVINGKRGHAPYISSKLALHGDYSSHNEIVEALEKYIDDDLPSPSSYTVRDLLSAMLEGLNNDVAWLRKAEIEKIYSTLAPLMRHCDIQQLLERHLRWNFD